MEAKTENKQRILLVEDNPSSTMFVRDYLDACGFEMICVDNGYDAIAQAQFSPPDLIIMDVQLPGLDGLQVSRQMRQLDELQYTPIIGLTALFMEQDRQRCLDAGMSDYLSKPVHLKELLDTVTKHLIPS